MPCPFTFDMRWLADIILVTLVEGDLANRHVAGIKLHLDSSMPVTTCESNAISRPYVCVAIRRKTWLRKRGRAVD